jgi:hypothetical protein
MPDFTSAFPGEADVDRSSLLANRDANDPERTYIGCVRRCRIASFSRKTVEHSFFWKPGLAQAIDNDRWGPRL